MIVKAHITPEVARWARERLGLTEADLAGHLPTKPEMVGAWERGDARPSFRQVRQMAKALRVPFGYFFLSRPPREKVPIPDLRTLRNSEADQPSPDLMQVLNDALRKQDWYREDRLAEGSEPLPFVGAFAPSTDPVVVAADIRKRLGMDQLVRAESGGTESYLQSIVNRAEQVGILVMRSSVVGSNSHRALSVAEFRGFALSDAIAPVIFVNSRDAKAAQVFTLAHELAHVWVGSSGISNVAIDQAAWDRSQGIESYCDQVAAEFLVPREQFVADWNPNERPEDAVARLTREYRVSSLVVIRRALDLGRIDRGVFTRLYDQALKGQRPTIPSGGGDAYATCWTRNSKRLTKAVVLAAFEGRLLFREAAGLLNVKVNTLHGLADRLKET